MSDALREVIGQRRLGAGGFAAALAESAPKTLKVLRDLIDRVLATDAAASLDTDLWGLNPSKADLSQAQADVDEVRNGALKRVLDDALTREQVADRLGITAQAVSKRSGGDQLVVFRYAGRSWYPRWQFSDHDAVPQLAELVPRFPSALSLTTWAMTPAADLDGLTPAQMLRRRDGHQRVLELAQASSAEAW